MPTAPAPDAIAQHWAQYLDGMQAQARHPALQSAGLAPVDSAPPPAYRAGSATLRLLFYLPPTGSAWKLSSDEA